MTSWQCRTEFVWRRLSDGGAFVVNVSSGDHFILNPTAAEVLEGLSARATVDSIVERFRNEYGVAAEELRHDVAAVARELSELGIIRPGEP